MSEVIRSKRSDSLMAYFMNLVKELRMIINIFVELFFTFTA